MQTPDEEIEVGGSVLPCLKIKSIKCAICLEEYELKDKVLVRLPCSHVYCLDCFNLMDHSRCPLCRNVFEAKIINYADFMNVMNHLSRPPTARVSHLDSLVTSALDEYYLMQAAAPEDINIVTTTRRPARRRRRTRRRDGENE